MHFSYVSGDCGSGKTNELFNNIINIPNLYIVAATNWWLGLGGGKPPTLTLQ